MTDTPQNHDAWLMQVAVPCPTCGAAVDAPCWAEGPRGVVEIRGTHNARKQAAR